MIAFLPLVLAISFVFVVLFFCSFIPPVEWFVVAPSLSLTNLAKDGKETSFKFSRCSFHPPLLFLLFSLVLSFLFFLFRILIKQLLGVLVLICLLLLEEKNGIDARIKDADIDLFNVHCANCNTTRAF